MKTQHTTIGTAAKRFASVVCLMSLAFGFAPSAQAYDPPPDITPYISTDNEFETEYNPFALPNTMAHWMSALVRHECWTSYAGGNRGFQSFWNCAGNWFMWTNHYYTVNMPTTQKEYYWNKVTQNYFPSNNFLGKANTCLAYIQRAAEAKVGTSGKLTDDAEIGENITVALCQLLRPHEYGDPFDRAPHLWCCSNHLQYVDTEYRVVRTSNFASGLRIDATSWNRSNKIACFNYYKYPKTAATEPNVAPTALVEIFYGHYSPGISNCIATLNRVSDDWTGTYLLHNRDYERTEVKETVRYLAYNEAKPNEPIETTTNRTRTVTHPDAWPALDEDVYLDRGDVLIMKSLCHMVDSAVQLLRAYELPGKKSGIWADPVCTNIVKVQENMHAIGYTYRTAWITNHLYRVGYSDRIERAINDTYHMLPDFFASIDDDVALAGAREAYLNALACFLDADAFITGKAKSKTGKTITGQRDPEQLHLIEFDEESQDEKGIAGWREFAEKTYASLTGKGTDAAVQTLDMVDLGQKLDIHVGSRGDADHGVIDFSSLGPNRDGKITFDANAFFDGKITRNAVILDGSAITTNGPGYMVATRFSTERSGGGEPGDSPYAYVNRLHLTLSSSTVSPTLNGLYPSGTLLGDLATMKAQFPASGESLRTGFAQMTDVTTCERAVINTDTTIADGIYTAPATTKDGGAFYVSNGATLIGTNVTFSGNSAASGGAINTDSGTVSMLGTFTLATDGDTIYNSGFGKLDWNLTGGNKGCLNGYQNLVNCLGTLQITIDDAIVAPTNIVIATGNLSDVTDKEMFYISVGTDLDAQNVMIDGTAVVSKNDPSVGYQIVREGDNLVFKCIKYTAVRTELESGASTNLVAGTTYTAAPTAEMGGAFYLNPNATLIGTNVTFAGNEATAGGAIYVQPECIVKLVDAVFENNKSSGRGGAIYNGAYGELTLENVTFRGNSPKANGGAIANTPGGTVNFDGTVTLATETDTISNTRELASGTLNWNLANGKHGLLNGYQNIYNTGTLKITVDDAIVAPTNIVIATGDFSDIAGKDTFTITDATTGAAYDGATIDGFGAVGPMGGTVGYKLVTEAAGTTTNLVLQVLTVSPRVVVTSDESPYFITNCTYTAVKTYSETGGAAYVEAGGTLVVSNVTFKDNSAYQGSAIRIEEGGIATFADVTFNHNGGVTGESVYNVGLVNLDGRVTVETFLFKGTGGLGYFDVFGTLNWNLTDGKAGLFCNYENLANDGGTLQITVENYAASTNFVIATGSFLKIEDWTDTFTITNATTGAAYTAKIDGGVTLSKDELTGYKLETVEDLSVPTTNLVFSVYKYTCQRTELGAGESTNLVAGVYTAKPTTEDGGAFYVDGGTLTGTDVTFAGNETTSSEYGYGGAIYFTGNGAVGIFEGATFDGNNASGKLAEGGAICNEETLHVSHSRFANNSAQDGFGGAIYNSGVATLDDVVFSGNRAGRGGAIYNSDTGMLNFDGTITLATEMDTLDNFMGTLNWNLADGKAGCLNGYQNVTNDEGTLQITIDDATQAPKDIVIATGDFTNIEGKDTFTITNATSGATTTVKIDGLCVTTDGVTGYKLVKVAAGETTNLVFKVLAPVPLTFEDAEGGTFEVTTNDAEIATGAKILCDTTVKVTLTAEDERWQEDLSSLKLVDATGKEFGAGYFTPSGKSATFPMTEYGAKLTVAFTVSDEYRNQVSQKIEQDAQDAKDAIDASKTATTEQKAACKLDVDKAAAAAKEALKGVKSPGEADAVEVGAKASFGMQIALVDAEEVDAGGATNVVEAGAWGVVSKAGECVRLKNAVIRPAEGAAAPGDCGAVLVDGGTLILDGVVVTGFDTKGLPVGYPGAPIRVASGALYLNGGCVITNNTAKKGGAVYVTGGNFTMVGGKITGNKAVWGGGVLVEGGVASVSGGEISGNEAVQGGGIAVVGGTATVTGGKVTENRADAYGGGVFAQGVDSGAVVTVPDVVKGNSSGLDPKADDVYIERAE